MVPLSLSVSVDVKGAGGAPENRGVSSSHTEGKAAAVSGLYGSPEGPSVV